jgi:hypothetical protein
VATCGLGLGAAAFAASAPPRACFELNSSTSWRVAGPKLIYIRSRVNEIYRLDLVDGSPTLQSPFAHLIFIAKGTSTICSPHDFDLEVSNGAGFRRPLFIASITRLTREEVAALPAKDRP